MNFCNENKRMGGMIDDSQLMGTDCEVAWKIRQEINVLWKLFHHLLCLKVYICYTGYIIYQLMIIKRQMVIIYECVSRGITSERLHGCRLPSTPTPKTARKNAGPIILNNSRQPPNTRNQGGAKLVKELFD